MYSKPDLLIRMAHPVGSLVTSVLTSSTGLVAQSHILCPCVWKLHTTPRAFVFLFIMTMTDDYFHFALDSLQNLPSHTCSPSRSNSIVLLVAQRHPCI